MTAEKVRENRMRRRLERRGYRLMKSRRRDPDALEYGTYQVIEIRHNSLAFGDTNHGFGMSLEDVEDWLNRE